MRNKTIAVLIATTLAAAALPLAAHHSFSAEFDVNKRVTLEGKVFKMEWVNPHSWLHIDVTAADGKTERWMIEGGSPNVLQRLGWTRDSLPAGTKIKVTGSQAKDGAKRLNSQSIEFPDGRKLSMGGSNPNEGTETKPK
jgi:hypothetical protein